jgi:ubiquinone/menaquinone biosynthesis C-methylase UbiE
MVKKLLAGLQKKSAERKTQFFEAFFKDSAESILDFGCGDLSLAKSLYTKNKQLKITGIDVVDFNEKVKGISFKKYNGVKIPFKDNAFDTVISVFVFHHCESAEIMFHECLRVAKKRVIIVEAVAGSKSEIPFMKFIDWMTNVWKREEIPLTYQFHTINEWKNIFRKAHTRLNTIRREQNVISVLPIGKTILFEVTKQ